MIKRLKRPVSIYILGIPFLFIVLWGQINHLQCTNKANENKIRMVVHGMLTHQALQEIDQDRRTSISKITDIITRYNEDMPESVKTDIANEIYRMSRKYPNLNIDFIAATITHESANSWDPDVVSRVGAIGLMQIMPSTGEYLALQEGIEWQSDILYDPLVNIRLGCRYLSEMVTMYEQDGGLAAYNAGPRIAQLWLASNRNNNILWKETRGYVPAILKLYAEFQTEGAM